MKKTWKRNLIAAGVLLVVCAGIYLNWYAGHSAADLTETLDAGKILDDTTLVLQQEQGDALVTPVQQTGTQAEYFAQMRLSRQTARDEAVELLLCRRRCRQQRQARGHHLGRAGRIPDREPHRGQGLSGLRGLYQ